MCAISSVNAEPIINSLQVRPESLSIWCFVVDDGSSVFGHSFADGVFSAYRWDQDTDWVGGTFPNEDEWSIRGISQEGSVVALNNRSTGLAYRWVDGVGLEELKQGDSVQIASISRDGRVIWGYQVPFALCRWVDGVYEQIDSVDVNTIPHVGNADGSVVFGHDYSEDYRAFVWDSSDDSYTLPDGPTPDYDAYVYDVNADGTLAVGFALEDPTVYKDSGDGFSDLAIPTKYEDGVFSTLPTDTTRFYQYQVFAMDEEAQIIGGMGNRVGTVDQEVALVWVGNGQPQLLSEYLLSQGLHTNGWAFQKITDITPDGRFITGSGYFENQLSAFIIDRFPSDVCLADITGDGVVDVQDVYSFIEALSEQASVADFTHDEEFNFFDVSAFLEAFHAGCP